MTPIVLIDLALNAQWQIPGVNSLSHQRVDFRTFQCVKLFQHKRLAIFNELFCETVGHVAKTRVDAFREFLQNWQPLQILLKFPRRSSAKFHLPHFPFGIFSRCPPVIHGSGRL